MKSNFLLSITIIFCLTTLVFATSEAYETEVNTELICSISTLNAILTSDSSTLVSDGLTIEGLPVESTTIIVPYLIQSTSTYDDTKKLLSVHATVKKIKDLVNTTYMYELKTIINNVNFDHQVTRTILSTQKSDAANPVEFDVTFEEKLYNVSCKLSDFSITKN